MIASADFINILRAPRPTVFRPPGYRPAYMDLEKIYNTYVKGQDLRPGSLYVNECAIRLSVALSMNGFSFARFKEKSRVKNGGHTGIPVPHVYGAHELAEYLKSEWGPPIYFGNKAAEKAPGVLNGKRGIIYFNNCSGKGDHIDLWNGFEFYNQILGTSAHAGYSGKGSLFERSDFVWFWEIR